MRFLARGAGGTFFFTPEEVVLSLVAADPDDLRKHKREKGKPKQDRRSEADPPNKKQSAAVRLQFVGANPNVAMAPGTELLGRINYMRGRDKARWQVNVPTYSSVEYRALFPGIDLTYDNVGGQLKGTYLVAPEADPTQIRWRYSGTETPFIDGSGNLVLRVKTSRALTGTVASASVITVTEMAPIAWQDSNGQQVPVDARYQIAPDGTIGFALGAYDRNLPLTIDPVLTYSSYWGGSHWDYGLGIQVDNNGVVFVGGDAQSPDFPGQRSNVVDGDAFVSKLDPSRQPGDQLIWTTLIIGSEWEYLQGVALGPGGTIYVSGHTYSDDLPAATHYFRDQCNLSSTGQCQDAFVAKIIADGHDLDYMSYLGSPRGDAAGPVAVDGEGNAYVFGVAGGNGFPTRNAVQTTCVQSTFGACNASFVTKLDTSVSLTNSLLYSTYLDGSVGGGWEREAVDGGLAVDGSGNVFVAGMAVSTNFPTTTGAYQSGCRDTACDDAFVAKIDTNASGTASLVYSTRLGGNQYETAQSLALDSDGYVYVTGVTESTDFPLENAAQDACAGTTWCRDVFVTKLNTDGTGLIYSTYLGGAEDDQGFSTALGADGRLHVTGHTYSTDFPTRDPIQSSNASAAVSGADAFAAVIDTTAATTRTLAYSTYLGGSDEDYGWAVDVRHNRPTDVYFTGATLSSDFPIAGNAVKSVMTGTLSAFITVIQYPEYVTGPSPDEVRCGGSPSETPTTLTAGSGVNTATGNFCYSAPQFAISGRGLPLAFNAVYNSDLAHIGKSITGTMGYGWTHNYNMWISQDAEGNYLVHEENGAIITFGADLEAPLGARATLTLNNGDLQLLRIQDQVRFDFEDLDSSGVYRLTSIVDVKHNFATQLSYSNGYLQTATEVTVPGATRSLAFGYANGLLSSVSGQGISVNLHYVSDALSYIEDIGGEQTHFAYSLSDGYRLLEEITDPNNGVLSIDYDPALPNHSRVIRQTDPMERALDFGYTSGQTVMTDSLGLVDVHSYSLNMLQGVTENATGQAAQWSYSYKPGTRWVEKVEDPLNNEWQYQWDERGNRTKVTDPEGDSIEYGPFANYNTLQAITNPVGIVTLYDYELWGDLRSVTADLGGLNAQTVYNYQNPEISGDVTSVEDPEGKSTSFEYDVHGYLTSATSMADNVTLTTRYRYDVLGRLLVMTDARGLATLYDYDDYGNPNTITDPLGNTVHYTYDANQNLKTVADANGNTTTYSYNKNNELVQARHPDNTYDDYLYDDLGRVISHTNGLRRTTLYDYDDATRTVTVTDPLLRVTVIQYDKAGNVSSTTDAAGRGISLGYYPDYQLHTVNYSDALTPDVEYVYDPRGLRTSMTDGLGTTQYGYDDLGRLTSIQDPNAKTVSYTYYLNGPVKEITYPSMGAGQRKVTYHYDGANRPNRVVDWLGQEFTFNYDATSNLTGIGRAAGLPDSGFGYDNAGRLTSIVHAEVPKVPVFKASYRRDEKGLLTAADESRTGTHAYSYDDVDRLIEEQLAAGIAVTRTWSYDAGTNIVATTISEIANTAQSQPIAAWSNLTGTTTTGNTIQKTGGTPYQWDAGAVSTRQIGSGDVTARATADNVDHYTQFGLGRNNITADGSDVDFSIRLAEGNVQVFELGTQRGGNWTTYAVGDIFNVALEGGVVKYYKNNTAFYTSTVEPTYPLRFDSSLADPNSRILDAHLTPGQCTLSWTSLDDVTANGNTIRKTGGVAYAWDAGAVSEQAVSAGDVSAQATAHNTDHYTQFGLGRNNTGADGDDIDFSIRLAEGNVQVFELGTQRGGNWTTYVAGDVFRVAVEDGVVRYYKNNTAFYTSQVAPGYPLRFDSSLADPNSRIWRAYLCAGPAPVMEWSGQTSVSTLSNTLTKTGATYAWDAGAASSASVSSGDVYAQAIADSDQVYTQFGLGSNNTTAHGEDIDFSIRLAEGNAQVFELGTQRGGNFATYEAGDVFTVAVAGGVVRYYKNGVAFYTSGVTPSYPLRFDSSIADPGARILAAQFGTTASSVKATTRTHDDGDQLLSLLETQGGNTTRSLLFAYNQVGDRVRLTDTLSSSANTSYAYDQAGRLTSFARAGNSTTYRYNGDGLRLRKTKGASTEYFTWDAGGLLLQDGNAAYIYGPGGMLLEQILNSGAVYHYHTDQLGSVRAVTNSSGQVVATYDYDAYGQTITSTGSIINPFRYAGEYTDSESGLIYLRARYYDPSTQVFLTPDASDTAQPYAYASGSPLNLTDPSGSIPIAPILVGAGVFLGGIALGVGADYVSDPAGFDLGTSLAGQFTDPLTYVGLIPGGVLAGLAKAGVVGKVAAGVLRILGAGCSFSGETLVSTEEGLRSISEIEVGDRVLAYDEASGTTGYYPVTAVLIHEDRTIELLVIDGEELETTPEHPFYTQEKGWVPAGELWVGAHVRRADGGYGDVEAVEMVQQAQRMYNLTVARAHTFFVGNEQWLVHNTCGNLDVHERAMQLQRALPSGSRGRVTMGVGVLENSRGERLIVIGTSEHTPAGRAKIRLGVRELIQPGEQVVGGFGHAEANIVTYARANHLRVVRIGAGRPICYGCEQDIIDSGGFPRGPTRSGWSYP